MTVRSLVYRVLDHHVVNGLADEIAVSDEHGMLSYAELLHESASIAGGLSHMGVEPGTDIVVDLPEGRDRVITVLACARIGAVPNDTAAFRVTGTPPVLHAPDTEVGWDLLLRAGRTEPASAPDRDADGYAELMSLTFPGIFDVLAGGGTIA